MIKIYTTNNSGFLGVTKVPHGYIARIRKDGKQHHLGCFPTALQASTIYQQAKATSKPTAKQIQLVARVQSIPTAKPPVTSAKELQAELREKFEYHDGVLRFRRTGKILGNKGTCGYITTGVKLTHGVSTLVHRLIFVYHHGYLPEELDHIDANRTNNRIKNLRPATRSQNLANSMLRYDNKTGYKGVHSVTSGYIAQIGYKGTRHYLGVYKTAKQAAVVYNKKAAELFGQYARVNEL